LQESTSKDEAVYVRHWTYLHLSGVLQVSEFDKWTVWPSKSIWTFFNSVFLMKQWIHSNSGLYYFLLCSSCHALSVSYFTNYVQFDEHSVRHSLTALIRYLKI